MVRILGAAPHRFKTELSCVCVDKSGYKIHTKVNVRQNKEHWALPYSSYFFNCLLIGTFRPVQVMRKLPSLFVLKGQCHTLQKVKIRAGVKLG